MKISIIGAAGVRTPLLVEAILKRQDQLGLEELALMDIDGERLEAIGVLTSPLEQNRRMNCKLIHTTDAHLALRGADFVITTFRVGGIESRAIDERVPLTYGVLGQETTGPGGFSMGIRSIPVLIDYVVLMSEVCPQAWLINFANPAGMLTEALTNDTGWERSVGICDAPSGMQRMAAALAGVQLDEIYLDYFGLNHLGWVRGALCNGRDRLPEFIRMIKASGGIPGLPFEPDLIESLGLIPNEYLYYYYYADQAVKNILDNGESRGEQIAAINQELFARLKELYLQGDRAGMRAHYQAYLNQRSSTYMQHETGKPHDLAGFDAALAQAMAGEGYAGVALDLIEGLSGIRPRVMVLNIPNRGAIRGMEAADVVEIPAYVMPGAIHPMAVGEIPAHCLGLMKQIKEYERLTITAAREGSYSKALLALTLHPLVADREKARMILDGYCRQHGAYFPELK